LGALSDLEHDSLVAYAGQARTTVVPLNLTSRSFFH